MAFWFEYFLIDLAVAVLIILTTIYLYSKFIYKHWAKNNIKYIVPSFPFGNTKQVLLKKISSGIFYNQVYNEFKKLKIPYGGLYFAMRPELLIIDPDIIKQILVKDFQCFMDRGTFNDPENEPLTGNLFSVDGHKWKTLRAKLTPTFTSGKMKMMFHTLVACSDELRNILEEKEQNGEPMDIKEYLARFTTDVIGSCAFGINCNCLQNPNTDFRKYCQQVLEPKGLDMIRQMGAFLLPNIYKTFKIKMLNKKVTAFFLNLVKDTVKYREENRIYRKDFLQLLIELKNKGQVQSSSLTDDELTDGETSDGLVNKVKRSNGHVGRTTLTIEQMAAQCIVFFIAGFETSSTTMTFCLYELVKNPDIQEKVRSEVNTILNKNGGKLTYEGIMEMHYLDKVINETLRKYPALPFLMRKCTKPYPLPNSNYTIQQGNIIRISILGLQRDPEYYPNPEKFDPERFNPEEIAKRPPFTFIPFGEGPRNCIGLRFGLMQTKVGLSVLLKNYKFTLNEKTREPLVMEPKSFMLSTKGGIWLDAHKVSN